MISGGSEMRIIDADALIKKANEEKPIGRFTLVEYLKNAPTVEHQKERPHGKWLTHQTGMLVWEECNQCKAHVGTIGFHYCPNCGADMREALTGITGSK